MFLFSFVNTTGSVPHAAVLSSSWDGPLYSLIFVTCYLRNLVAFNIWFYYNSCSILSVVILFVTDRAVFIWSTKDWISKEHKNSRLNVDFDHASLVCWSPDSKAFVINRASDNVVEVYKVSKRTDGWISSITKAITFPQVINCIECAVRFSFVYWFNVPANEPTYTQKNWVFPIHPRNWESAVSPETISWVQSRKLFKLYTKM